MRNELAVYQNISACLEKHRVELNISKRQLSKVTGITPVYIREVLRGERKVSVYILLLLCEAMGIKLSDLFSELEKEEKF